MVDAREHLSPLPPERRVPDAIREIRRRLEAEGTSSDVGTRGLGVRRAEVAGQMLPGMLSAFVLPEETAFPGLPYAIFAGNVGGPDSLARVIEIPRGD